MKKTSDMLFLLVVLLISLIAGCACSNSGFGDGCYEMIDIEAEFAQVKGLLVEDLGENISYVPLETTDESLIGKRAYVRLLKDKLLVGSFQQPIKMFDKETGAFIRTVGHIGQGVNEYTLQDGVPVFWTDDEAEIIYVQTEGTYILRFDVNGTPLDRVSLPDSFPRMTTVSQVMTENKLYAYKQTLFNKNEYKLFTYDLHNGEMEKFILNEEEIIPSDFSQMPLSLVGFGAIPGSTSCLVFTLKDGRMILFHTKNPCLWVFDKKIYFKENFNDTIYQIEENKLRPRAVFNLGDRQYAYRDRFNANESQNKIVINYVLEGRKAIYFVFQTNYYNFQDAKTYCGVYNKNNKSVKVSNKLQIRDSANDFLIKELQTATSDGQLVGLVDAASFLENTDNEPLFDIEEEDNPIVVIVE